MAHRDSQQQLTPPMNVVDMLPHAVSFQRSAASDKLEQWWLRSHGGVCTLVGIGGCGKTATAADFLRSLGVFAPSAAGGARSLDKRPAGALVASLGAEGADRLFFELHLWTGGDFEAKSVGLEPVRRRLATIAQSSDRPILLVLDGLEAVQAGAGDAAAGRVLDQRLRGLLTRVAYGAMPGLCVLATTRHTIVDIEAQRLPSYLSIEMDEMDAGSAVALLRARGAAGSDSELRRVADGLGHHALALDLHTVHGASTAQTGEASATTVEERIVSLVEDLLSSLARKEGADSAALASSVLEILAMLRRPVSRDFVDLVLQQAASEGLVEERWSETVVEPLIGHLIQLRLVRDLQGAYSLHEVVREQLYGRLPDKKVVRWHGLLARVAIQVASKRDADPSGSDVLELLDLWENVVHHQVLGPSPMEAFVTYYQVLGSYSQLGHRLGAFARGERLCRSLNLGRRPDRPADYLLGDSRGAVEALLTDWGLYLLDLGDAESALAAFRTAHEQASQGGNLASLPIASQNLSVASLHRGDISGARMWASRGEQETIELLRQLEGIPTAEVMRGFEENASAAAAALAVSGDVEEAEEEFQRLVVLHRDAAKAHGSLADSLVLYEEITGPIPDGRVDLETFQDGRPWSKWLLQRGDSKKAAAIAEGRIQALGSAFAETSTVMELRAIAASAHLALDDPDSATAHVDALESWAGEHESLKKVCVAHHLRATLLLVVGDDRGAYNQAREGLLTAREAGLGLEHLDLLIVLSRAALRLGDFEEALHAASTALFGQEALREGEALYEAPARDPEAGSGSVLGADPKAGIYPPERSGRPSLVGALHPSCGYRAGEAGAREVRGEASLARLAATARSVTFDERSLDPQARSEVARARRDLQRALSIYESLVPTDRHSADARITRIRDRILDLERGQLTRYQIETLDRESVEPPEQPDRIRILISYSHRDADFARRLADDLDAHFGDVWIDHRRVHAGESFVSAINRALMFVSDFVVILTAHSIKSRWVENELNVAIARRNQGKPIRIRPVVTGAVELPPLIADIQAVSADSTRYVDALEELIRAIESDSPSG